MSAKLVYFFCHKLDRDPVALHVYNACRENAGFGEASFAVDNLPVAQWVDDGGNSIYLVRTSEVVTDRYEAYADIMAEHFPDAAAAAAVNWHEGANAPDRIFSVHTNADVSSGNFGITDPVWMRAFLLAAEDSRLHFELSDWTVAVEASHWSGTMSGSKPELVVDFPTPMFDVEIGSSRSSWTEPRAARALARALLHAPHFKAPVVHSLLCVGGVHFESSFRDAVFSARDPGHAVSHILPTRWIQDDGYRGASAISRMRQCVGTIHGGVQAVVYHDSLKSDQKGWIRDLAAELAVPCVKHRLLRNGGL